MSRERALFALDEMRDEIDDGNISLAAQWAMVYMAETGATEFGREMMKRREARIERINADAGVED